MAETLLQFQHPVPAPDGSLYDARACGSPMRGGTWHGWIEFVPRGGGTPVCSPRETTQPNRVDTEYWATGVSAVYLEGALRRALVAAVERPVQPTQPPPALFDGPAPSPLSPTERATPSVLDPFSVYDKGEPLLRRQLAALSAWHLVNIVLDYELSDRGAAHLNALSPDALINMIVSAVRLERDAAARRR
jgi:hypothetical protein